MSPVEMHYYGGVTTDLSYTLLSGFILLPLTIVDLPLSLVGDTLTIPVVAIAKKRDSARWKETSFLFRENKYDYQIPSSEIIVYSLSIEYVQDEEKKHDQVSFGSLSTGRRVTDGSGFFYTEGGVKCKSTPQYISLIFPQALDANTTVKVRYKQQ
ncbi:YceK/YidQ family lipoprotein [Candidatus Uabimicrobium amorphum]|uniref:Uncharacterized protein n=1 Tax=Uabimicrobium amorphum TaxID=2596890 RepID=A0A5S9F603_UABAM|nr:YceK/YidQ family lipoprotein [Candidatus Uabimicrobium amorphum]BBM87182.1 hypothetical protein UABAM_05585 [Candidatus Uabimicrobium amorphum]